MRTITLMLACLACAGHGRRLQDGLLERSQRPSVATWTSAHGQGLGHRDGDDDYISAKSTFSPSQRLRVLSMLLVVLNSAAAFHPSSLACAPSGTLTLAGSHPLAFYRGNRVFFCSVPGIRMSDEPAKLEDDLEGIDDEEWDIADDECGEDGCIIDWDDEDPLGAKDSKNVTAGSEENRTGSG
mmetsp:Transcript_55319/g.99350  ORF Transcript_55319/g.99350 Transcript_55319/m.99350 type:complete len:183 (-) Transcript_55319:26-574(-)